LRGKSARTFKEARGPEPVKEAEDPLGDREAVHDPLNVMHGAGVSAGVAGYTRPGVEVQLC
jgi:hypothetical protein